MKYLPHCVLPRIAAELNNVGILLHESNMLDDAENIYRDAMKVILAFGPHCAAQAGHEEIEETQRWNNVLMKWKATAQEKVVCAPSTMPNVPVLTAAPSDYKKMPSVCSRPLSVEIKSDHSVDMDTMSLLVMHNLAVIQLLKGEKKKAVQLFDMAISQIPSEHNMNATEGMAAFSIHFNYGMLSIEEGRLQESLNMLLNALNLAEAVLGDHTLVAGTMHGVGHMFLCKGMIQHALEMFASASEIMFEHYKESKDISVKKERNGNGAKAA